MHTNTILFVGCVFFVCVRSRERSHYMFRQHKRSICHYASSHKHNRFDFSHSTKDAWTPSNNSQLYAMPFILMNSARFIAVALQIFMRFLGSWREQKQTSNSFFPSEKKRRWKCLVLERFIQIKRRLKLAKQSFAHEYTDSKACNGSGCLWNRWQIPFDAFAINWISNVVLSLVLSLSLPERLRIKMIALSVRAVCFICYQLDNQIVGFRSDDRANVARFYHENHFVRYLSPRERLSAWARCFFFGCGRISICVIQPFECLIIFHPFTFRQLLSTLPLG